MKVAIYAQRPLGSFLFHGLSRRKPPVCVRG